MTISIEKAPEHALEKSVARPDVPWCSICLVGCILLAHTIVLAGNMSTAAAFGSIGDSTKGWSKVGIHLSNSVEGELEGVLKEVVGELTEALQEIQYVTNMMDMVVGLHSKSIDAVVMHNATKALVLLQAHGIMDASQVADGLAGMVSKSMLTTLQKLTGMLDKAIHKLLKKIKPTLITIGKFILKFGEKVQAIIESFSVTLDRVQKIFDQIMASAAQKGKNALALEHETWHLFDTTDTGTILPIDLKHVGSIYNVPALMGNKSDDLVTKYDTDKSGALDKKEFAAMIHDKDVPNIMSVVLRSFAKSLAQVAGQVGGSKFRGEIAMDVADYLELMTAKNLTKVSWIADALANNSLPIEFTADVLASIALRVDDPNTHKSIPTGKTVISEMMKIHPRNTGKAIDMLSNATYWTSQGFDPKDHAECVKRITKWSMQHHKSASLMQIIGHEEAAKLLQDEAAIGADGKVDLGSPTMLMERKLVDVMQDLAHNVAAENMRVHLATAEEERRAETDALLGSDTAQFLLLQLMGGERACNMKSHPNSPSAQSLKSQIPAAPETMQFAKFLSWNASSTAKRFQQMATDYQKTSSNAIDSFATQIQGMVKKIQGFIKMMMQYSTPDGIKTLENMLINYAKKAIREILLVTKQRVGPLLEGHSVQLTAGLDTPTMDTDVLIRIERALQNSPLGEDLAPEMKKALKHGKHAEIGREVASLFESLANVSITSVSKSLEDRVGKIDTGKVSFIESRESLKDLHFDVMGPADPLVMADIGKDVERALQAPRNGEDQSLLQTDNKLGNEDGEVVAGLMEDVVQVLHSLTHVIPQATKALLFARKETSMLAKTLDNIFRSFETSGPDILGTVESAYGSVWTLYWFMMILVPVILLFYAFWGGGFMGGPGSYVDPEHEDKVDEYEQFTCFEKVKNCFCLCFSECCHIQGLPSCLCFWSFAIMAQFLVLFLFIMGAVVSIVSAVQMFVAAGCSQIYILGDQSICGGVLGALRMFLDTFLEGVDKSDFPAHCSSTNLLTCNLIGDALKKSAMMTILGSFLAAFMTFQLLIESSRVHAIAVQRLRIQTAWLHLKHK